MRLRSLFSSRKADSSAQNTLASATEALESGWPLGYEQNTVAEAVQITGSQGNHIYPISVEEARNHVLNIRQGRGFGADGDEVRLGANVNDLERALELYVASSKPQSPMTSAC